MAVRKQPVRKCLGCNEMLGKKGLLRIVKSPDGAVMPTDTPTNTPTALPTAVPTALPLVSLDLTGKKSGRGAYICRDAECFKKARKKKSLERSLKCAIPDEIYEAVLAEIEKL